MTLEEEKIIAKNLGVNKAVFRILKNGSMPTDSVLDMLEESIKELMNLICEDER